MRRRHPRRFRDIPVNALIPNALTVLGLSLGLTAIRLALLDRWEIAVAAVIAAGIVDGLDGRVARILKASTAFGAQLDSLSDFLCFGVAPALMLYLWALQEGRAAGWAVALIYSVCMALRLARFNAGLTNPDRPAWTSKFFTGLPAPAASIVVLIPMMLSFELGDTVLRQPVLVAFHVVFVALLMVSTIPMYAGKGIRVRPDHVLPALLLVGFLFALLAGYPWYVLPAVGVGYLATIPFSIRACRRLRAQAAEADADSGDEEVSVD